MRKFANRLKSEQGFSLVEMIAAMTLFSMIVGIITMVTMFGFRSYHKITIENSLRDEADILMSSIITEMYTFGPEKVENTGNGIKLTKGSSEEKWIQLVEEAADPDQGQDGKTQLILSDASTQRVTAVNSELTGSTLVSSLPDGRLCRINEPCQTGLIDIHLVLTQIYDGKPYEMVLDSKFGF
ncbi:prepilin-type N-terminal cleavage/methylation domain-containing protein [Paenibacillus sp. BR2-3]|uniref:type IV pilus modification PilV family protein n=1 Tax=Paenibacillus sp. BR2-3 TaxID=3048494 RepID=UPI00397752F9